MSRLEKSSAAGPLCCSPILYYEKNSKSKSVLVPVLNIGIKMVFEGTLGRKEKVMNDSLTRYFIKTKIKYSLLNDIISLYIYIFVANLIEKKFIILYIVNQSRVLVIECAHRSNISTFTMKLIYITTWSEFESDSN